ncbi:nucleosome assembly protein Nap1 [Schizosaccharomyces japonicus yFS275]|uniref:Nucleosome assembly protein Nap1 n=1 Tax=Schizosaccharomyces japonicus (strain yFS275 / FY16936) TaxID=402676 RepID=B6K249_SCHJY|nr:nucleosome assembly protein Nap1 [Schizosaccharomyces japonicus yFS275]EEB07230.1 nucleosome assembly protein Nap1 [Schizosaccharomyces japonicus yFS275]
MAENVDITGKRVDKLSAAPTPHNTPSGTAAPISSAKAPQFMTIEEGDEGLGEKLGSLAYDISSLPASVRRRLSALKGLEGERNKLEVEFQHAILELEKEFSKKYEPLYARRAEIVRGAREPTSEEIEKGEYDVESNGEAEQEKAVETKGIPEFWLTAMKNDLMISEAVTTEDEEALKHLVDIRLSYPEKPGFTLEFEFEKNDFFTNTVLKKTYYYGEQPTRESIFLYDHAEGDKIEWLPNRDLTVRVVTKKQRNKTTKQTRVVKSTVKRDSFFDFFTALQVGEDGEDAEVDENGEDIDDLIARDYEVAENFKERLIPHAVEWFTGEILALENYDNFSDIEEEDEEDEFDDEHVLNLKDKTSADDEDSLVSDDDEVQNNQNPTECRQQ